MWRKVEDWCWWIHFIRFWLLMYLWKVLKSLLIHLHIRQFSFTHCSSSTSYNFRTQNPIKLLKPNVCENCDCMICDWINDFWVWIWVYTVFLLSWNSFIHIQHSRCEDEYSNHLHHWTKEVDETKETEVGEDSNGVLNQNRIVANTDNIKCMLIAIFQKEARLRRTNIVL